MVKLHRKITPAQHAVFLQHISTIKLEDDEPTESDLQTQCNTFYDVALDLLNKVLSGDDDDDDEIAYLPCAEKLELVLSTAPRT